MTTVINTGGKREKRLLTSSASKDTQLFDPARDEDEDDNALLRSFRLMRSILWDTIGQTSAPMYAAPSHRVCTMSGLSTTRPNRQVIKDFVDRSDQGGTVPLAHCGTHPERVLGLSRFHDDKCGGHSGGAM
jgi:hypothetical protein